LQLPRSEMPAPGFALPTNRPVCSLAIGDIMTEVFLAGVNSAESPRWPSERALEEVGVDGTASYFDFFPDDSSAFSWTRAAESMFESE